MFYFLIFLLLYAYIPILPGRDLLLYGPALQLGQSQIAEPSARIAANCDCLLRIILLQNFHILNFKHMYMYYYFFIYLDSSFLSFFTILLIFYAPRKEIAHRFLRQNDFFSTVSFYNRYYY